MPLGVISLLCLLNCITILSFSLGHDLSGIMFLDTLAVLVMVSSHGVGHTSNNTVVSYTHNNCATNVALYLSGKLYNPWFVAG